MIEKHIVNIGYPRCGTSWLWRCAKFEPVHDKENKILMTDLNFDRYQAHYNQYQVSANFQTNLWHVDREIISFVHQHASHISIILRNPYNFSERYFDWIHRPQNQSDLVNYIVSAGFLNYYDVVTRWMPGARKFKIFFFEDLESSPQQFFEDYMSFCELPIANSQHINYNTKINANPKLKKTTIEFTENQILFINQEIDKFQQLVDRNLSHWKK